MLEIKDLKVSYNSRVVIDNLNIDIPKGSLITLLGPSGCGKSTLVKTIAGIKEKRFGSILLDGKDVHPTINNIGYIPQDYGLLPWKDVRSNITLSTKIKGNYDIRTFDTIVGELNIGHLLSKYPKDISGGEKQRVAIARALTMKCEIMLLDEPFSSLDTKSKENASKLLLDVWKKHETTSIIVTHDIETAMYLGQTIVVMSKGCNIVASISNSYFGEDKPRDTARYFEQINYIKSIFEDIAYEDR